MIRGRLSEWFRVVVIAGVVWFGFGFGFSGSEGMRGWGSAMMMMIDY